jgi:hypothetical protein
MKGRIVRILVVICLFSFCVGILVLVANSIDAGSRDFISYWAAGKQLVHRANPYDATAILRIERAAGYTGEWPNMLLNMPTAFFLVLPLGLVGAKTGIVLWFVAFIACLMESVRLLWKLHGRPDNRMHLLCYLFAPVFVCMMAGQLGAFLLLGVVLFLYFHESRPFLAGAGLLLCTVKPHLFLPFGIVLLAWALNRKAFRVLVGIAVALAASCALSLFLDVHAWSEYSSMMRSNAGIQRDFVPTLSVLLRLSIDRNAVWLQYVPAAAACVWALWYFWTRRAIWNWLHHGMLLLLVSELCAPHAWFTDEVMVLPAILAGLYSAKNSTRLLLLFGLMTGGALLEFLAGVKLVSPYYLWTAPAWLAWYLLARARTSAPVRPV